MRLPVHSCLKSSFKIGGPSFVQPARGSLDRFNGDIAHSSNEKKNNYKFMDVVTPAMSQSNSMTSIYGDEK
jgi:hypothetical protein